MPPLGSARHYVSKICNMGMALLNHFQNANSSSGWHKYKNYSESISGNVNTGPYSNAAYFGATQDDLVEICDAYMVYVTGHVKATLTASSLSSNGSASITVFGIKRWSGSSLRGSKDVITIDNDFDFCGIPVYDTTDKDHNFWFVTNASSMLGSSTSDMVTFCKNPISISLSVYRATETLTALYWHNVIFSFDVYVK